MRLGYGLLALTLAACSGTTPTSYNGQPGGNGGGVSASVSVINISYSPMDINLKVGGTVTWTNDDQVSHSVTEDTMGGFDGTLSGGMPGAYGGTTGGGSFSHTFLAVGSFMYHCKYHSTMHGTVNVTQ